MVLRSEDNPDVIMNSLAAYFVAEMDECACALRSDGRIRLSHYAVPLCPDVYQYLCPPAIQRVLEDEKLFPPLGESLCFPAETTAVCERSKSKRLLGLQRGVSRRWTRSRSTGRRSSAGAGGSRRSSGKPSPSSPRPSHPPVNRPRLSLAVERQDVA